MSGHNRQQKNEEERPSEYKQGKLQKLSVGREIITKMSIQKIETNIKQK